MATVELSSLTKRYGVQEVIHGLSASFADGAFVVLVGPSGCGKSTLLRMIAGLESITAGQVLIGGRVVNQVAPKRRDIAMVFQNYALYPHMSVAQNMGFALKLEGVARAEIEARVREAAAILGLEALLDRRPAQLSGGQRQRVAMGRAIVRSPQLFLFDEPLSNLDAKLRVTMRGEIKELHQRLGTTMIYVTHDQIEAMTMADTIVVMNEGRIEQMGSPLDLYDHPANVFVAQFIGSPAMNVLPVTIEAEGCRTPSGAVVPGNGLGEPGTEASLGFRPEHVEIVPEGCGFAASVAVVEPTGAETHLLCRLGADSIDVILKERRALAPGAVVHLRIQDDCAHLFDAERGTRLN